MGVSSLGPHREAPAPAPGFSFSDTHFNASVEIRDRGAGSDAGSVSGALNKPGTQQTCPPAIMSLDCCGFDVESSKVRRLTAGP
jgi:hypothetical protein